MHIQTSLHDRFFIPANTMYYSLCISVRLSTPHFMMKKKGEWLQYITNIKNHFNKITRHFKSICHFEPHLVDRPVDRPITLYTAENLTYKL